MEEAQVFKLSINTISDVLIENDSLYIGHDPNEITTDTAQYNEAVGVTALNAITSGDSNTAVANALTANKYDLVIQRLVQMH